MVVFDGICGAGKTELINILSEKTNNQLSFLKEASVKNDNLTEILKNIYEQMSVFFSDKISFNRTSFSALARAFQFKVMSNFALTHFKEGSEQFINSKMYVNDRSLDSCYIFNKAYFELGLLDRISYEVIMEAWIAWRKNLGLGANISKLVYLVCPVEIAQERIIKRNRFFDRLFPIQFNEKLSEIYNDYLTLLEKNGTKVLKVLSNKAIDYEKILDFIGFKSLPKTPKFEV